MADVTVINGAGRMASRLARLGEQGEREINRVIAVTTALTHEAIVDKITNDVRPHSGMSRKNNPQPVVTDLVDTGAYRQSWQEHVEPGRGKVFTNIEYALVLEFGDDDMEGFGVVRDTARKMRREYAKRMRNRVQELMA